MGRSRTARPPAAAAARPAHSARLSPIRRSNAAVIGTPLPSLVAAAAVSSPSGGSGEGRRSSTRATDWQSQCWAYFHVLGVAKYAANFYGKCLSRIRLVPGLVGPDGRPTDAIDDDGPVEGAVFAEQVSAILADLRASYGGQPALLRSLGINLFVAGECRLMGREDEARQTESWDVFSTNELRPLGDGKYERLGGPKGRETIDVEKDGATVCRIWIPDEEFKNRPDSSLRGVLEWCEELHLLTREARAETLSRLPNGILAIADEISYGGSPIGDRVDSAPTDVIEGDIPPDDVEEDAFTTDLLAAAMASIRDKGSAAAMLPLIVRGPQEAIEKGIRHILLSRPDSARTILKRRECVEMFAMGVDLPVEVVTGHKDTTFANANQIDEDTYKVHILPLMQIVADALTVGYLWPKMAAAQGVDPDSPLPDDITRHVVFWDATHLISNPEKTQESLKAHEQYAISDGALRRVLRFGPGDAPTDEEVARRVQIARLTRSGQTTRVTLADAPDADRLEDQTPAGLVPALAASAASLLDPFALFSVRLAAAADVAVERAVERAGSRLRNLARKNGHSAHVEGVSNVDVAVQLGPSVCYSLLGSEALFPGEFAPLTRRAHEWATEAGLTAPAEIAGRVASLAEQVAERRLFGGAGFDPTSFLALLSETAVLA